MGEGIVKSKKLGLATNNLKIPMSFLSEPYCLFNLVLL
jgi:hypothetical protein